MKIRGSRLHWLRAFVRNTLHGGAGDRDLRAHVNSYVDLLADEKIAAGMPPDAARRAALVEFGGLDAVKEETRAVRAGALVAQLWQDTRYAMRTIRRDPGFSLVAILTLALGIGANTAIFSVVNAVLLEPLSYGDPDRLVIVWERNPAIGKERDPVAPLNFQDWRAQNTVFEELGAFRFRGFTLTHVDEPERLDAVSMTTGAFRALDVPPLLGRVFTEEEERRRDRVVVLTHQLWQRRFAGDRTVVGRSISLDGDSFTVLGVMPPSFKFPDGNPTDVYAPLLFRPDELRGRRAHTLTVIGKLKPAVTIESALVDLRGVARGIAAQDNTSNPDVTIVAAHDVLVEDVRLALVILLGTVGFVLLIACANVANLLLVRAASRRREFAVRAALGAGKPRLLRQLLTENVLLSTFGAAGGVLVAWWLLRAFVRFDPPNLPRVEDVGLDTPVLLFVTATALLTGIAFGLVPALQASRPRLMDAMSERTQGSTAASGRRHGRAALLAAEIALSLMLLAGAGLMVRSLLKLQAVDLGFQSENVLTAQLFLSPARHPPSPVPDARPGFFSQVEEALKAEPGIEAAGAVSSLPLNPIGTDFDLPVIIEGRPRPRAGEEPQADFRVATPGYFRTMRIPLLRGREFTEFDRPNSAPVVLINETMARRIFPGEDALGKRIILYGRPREVVGIVGSVRHHGFSREPRPEMILPHQQAQIGAGMTLVARGNAVPSVLAQSLTRAVHSVDAAQPVVRLLMMEEFLSDSVAQPRFTTFLLVGFAGLALLLALVGVYGVMSYTVSQRVREIGVRLAMGANPHEVVGMIVRQGMAPAAVGVVIGLCGAVAGAKLMSGLLFGISATDPLTFVAAAAALVLTALAATYAPAFRAARISPVTILKAE
jgi:putative ABC transport system permease protein